MTFSSVIGGLAGAAHGPVTIALVAGLVELFDGSRNAIVAQELDSPKRSKP